MNKKTIIWGIFLLLLFSSIIPVSSSYRISSNNDIIYVDDDGGADYTRIQDAIDNASDGDTIFVYNGTYYEHLRIFVGGILLIGENKNSTIIDGGSSDDVIIVFANNVQIRNFMLINSDSITGHGIRTKGIMDINEVYNVSIIGNIITGFNYGIRCEDSYDILIFDNVISYNKYGGISVEDSHNFDIKFNNITYSYFDENNGDGIGLSWSNNISVTNNKIMNNVDGIELIKSYDNIISKNNIKDNIKYGISIISTDKSYYNNLFSYNNIQNNRNGIKLNSDKNIIINNNFIENINYNAYFYGLINIWKGNYWNKEMFFPVLIHGKLGPTGILYQISWFNIDWNPAKEPYDIPSPEVSRE